MTTGAVDDKTPVGGSQVVAGRRRCEQDCEITGRRPSAATAVVEDVDERRKSLYTHTLFSLSHAGCNRAAAGD